MRETMKRLGSLPPMTPFRFMRYHGKVVGHGTMGTKVVLAAPRKFRTSDGELVCINGRKHETWSPEARVIVRR